MIFFFIIIVSGDFHKCDCGGDGVAKCEISVLGLLLT